MSDMPFSLATHDDIPEIVRLYRSLVGTPGCAWDDEYPSRETAEEDIDRHALYTLRKDNQIIAVASIGDFDELGHLSWKPQHPCELARTGVLPAMQGQGIGTAILRRVMEAARKKGYDGIRMIVSTQNPAALAMYDKAGFERGPAVFMYDTDFYCYQIVF